MVFGGSQGRADIEARKSTCRPRPTSRVAAEGWHVTMASASLGADPTGEVKRGNPEQALSADCTEREKEEENNKRQLVIYQQGERSVFVFIFPRSSAIRHG